MPSDCLIFVSLILTFVDYLCLIANFYNKYLSDVERSASLYLFGAGLILRFVDYLCLIRLWGANFFNNYLSGVAERILDCWIWVRSISGAERILVSVVCDLSAWDVIVARVYLLTCYHGYCDELSLYQLSLCHLQTHGLSIDNLPLISWSDNPPSVNKPNRYHRTLVNIPSHIIDTL